MSTHSVVTLVTLSLVARLWPVMMDTVELWTERVLLSVTALLSGVPTLPEPVDPTQRTQLPASAAVLLVLATLRNGERSDPPAPAITSQH